MSILTIGALSVVSPFFGREILVWLVDAGSFAIVVAYIFVVISFLRLRLVEPAMPRPFRVPYGIPFGLMTLGLTLGLFCLYLPGSPAALLWPQEWAMLLAASLVGLVFYLHGRSK